jgi:hypothetical protein
VKSKRNWQEIEKKSIWRCHRRGHRVEIDWKYVFIAATTRSQLCRWTTRLDMDPDREPRTDMLSVAEDRTSSMSRAPIGPVLRLPFRNGGFGRRQLTLGWGSRLFSSGICRE